MIPARDLEQYGYCVVEDVLSGGEVQELRRLISQAADRDRETKNAWFSNGNQKVFMLLNDDDWFLRLALHEAAMPFVSALLGADALLSSMNANIALPGNKPQKLHADQQYVTPPWGHCFAMNIIWILDSFTAENGATRVVPESHKKGFPPPDDGIDTIPILGALGSMVVLDGRVWHGSGENSTESEERMAILAHYCAPFLRQQENVFRSIDPQVRHRLTPELRKLLGYDIWQGLGVVNGFPRSWMGRVGRSGPTNADQIFENLRISWIGTNAAQSGLPDQPASVSSL